MSYAGYIKRAAMDIENSLKPDITFHGIDVPSGQCLR